VWTGTAARQENATPARERIGEQARPAQNVTHEHSERPMIATPPNRRLDVG
jgi:hypothetical protein